MVPFCDSTDRAEALIAPDVITMEDDPIQAVMTKRKSSIVIGCRAVKKGNADGFFSAGSTGAVTAAGTAYVTPFRYVTAEGERRPIRPCITSTLPNRSGGLTVFCDMGANPDVDPDDMVRFAQMGAAYASCVLGVKNPRIGLMSNGTEDTKGSHFTKECFPLMRQQVKGFAGNCEGSDMVSGNVDVVVTDGFAGNVALKATEGAAKFIMSELKGALMGSLKGKIAAVLLKDELKAIKAKLSGDAKGGAYPAWPARRGCLSAMGRPLSRPSRTVRSRLQKLSEQTWFKTSRILWRVSSRDRSSTRPRIRQRLPAAFNLPYRSG